MWDAAIEHRQQHNNFDVSAFCASEINWEKYQSEHAANHSKAPKITWEEFQQVQRTCVESYLAKRKFHVRLSTRYVYRFGLANLLLCQGDLQCVADDADPDDSSSAESDLADLAKHAADAVKRTVPGDSADTSATPAGSSTATGAAASAESAATAGSSTGAADHAQAAPLSPTSPAQSDLSPALSPTRSPGQPPLTWS